MRDFNYYLEKIGEIGFVEESVHSLIYASGLPSVHPHELVIFEDGEMGEVINFNDEKIGILLITGMGVNVGKKIVRTGEYFSIGLSDKLLGRMIDPLGRILDGKGEIKEVERRKIDARAPKISERKQVSENLETGVSLVDLVIPLGKGQRELIIGDRKTGKTEFLLQVVLNQSRKGTICIYAVIGQKQSDIQKLYEFMKEKQILEKVILVVSSSASPSGLILATPFSAITIAEFFRDMDRDVLLILDDMTTHARTYREISLLSRSFPGRGSYPGDIFYYQSKIVERTGNFHKGSITLLPVAETVLGDLSGYIQTNLMGMTDGHIFFDVDLFNQGKRPSINPFLSVTRVGHQTQTALQKDLSVRLLGFLVEYEKMKQFLHFGAEVGEEARKILDLGQKIDIFLNQDSEKVIPINANIFILAAIWAGIWTEATSEEMEKQFEFLSLSYQNDADFRKKVDETISRFNRFSELVEEVRRNPEMVRKVLKMY